NGRVVFRYYGFLASKNKAKELTQSQFKSTNSDSYWKEKQKYRLE
ncbi:MAG: hypothetical protein ACI9QN_001178, partial [Arcticibacterium sp.]